MTWARLMAKWRGAAPLVDGFERAIAKLAVCGDADRERIDRMHRELVALRDSIAARLDVPTLAKVPPADLVRDVNRLIHRVTLAVDVALALLNTEGRTPALRVVDGDDDEGA